MTAAPDVIVVCVDGGIASLVQSHDLFRVRNSRWKPTDAMELHTVYPSSTAPAHASMLTGAPPRVHGIVGNRFWDEESVSEIRRRSSDPLLTFHPYDSSSLWSPSLPDDLHASGRSGAAVHFPQTVSLRKATNLPAVYCLYSPSRRVPIHWVDSSRGVARSEYFGEPFALTITREHGDVVVSIGERSARLTLVAGRARLDFILGIGAVSVSVGFDPHADMEIHLGTAAIQLSSGGMPQALGQPGHGPASLSTAYNLGVSDFYEAPRAQWIERAAFETVSVFAPDVLFLRFNQADHAQEALYWHAVRGDEDERRIAREGILQTYLDIDARVQRLIAEFGSDTRYLFFSDHGIDYVERHLRLNTLIEDLGFSERMVFQGDSNVAYLYTDEPLRESERRAITSAIRRIPACSILDHATMRQLGLAAGSPRSGRMVVTCGEHTEFQYDLGSVTTKVQSASHGHLPTNSAMSGFVRTHGLEPFDPQATVAITDLRAKVLSTLNIPALTR